MYRWRSNHAAEDKAVYKMSDIYSRIDSYCGIIRFLFAKTGYINYIIRQADSKENNENVFILGASHARCAIDPAAIEKNSDDRVLNMSIPGETIKDSYYLIQELNRTNDVEKVILDIDYNYWYGNLGEGCFAEPFLYNQYRWTSPVKWKYLIENTDMMDFRNAFTKKICI